MAKLVADCATKLDLESHKKLLSATQFDLEVLRTDFDNSLGVVNQLSNSQCSQSNRISALESSVAGKIDRSEVDHLQGLVAKVLLYDAFKTDTIESLQQLHVFRLSASARLGEHDAHLVGVDEEVRRLHESLALAATKRDTKALALELQAQEDMIRLCSSKDSVAKVTTCYQHEVAAHNYVGITLTGICICLCTQVESSVARTQKHVAHIDGQIRSIEVQAGLIAGELETKASLAALRECVTRRHYEQAVAALGAELELKCTQTSVSALQNHLQVLTYGGE